MKKVVMVVVVVLGFGVSALASGGTSCWADYGDIKIEIGLVNSRAPGAPVISGISGNPQVTVEQKGRRTLEFDVKTELIGWWSVGDEINMIFWKQTELGWVTLKIETTYSDIHEVFLGTFEYENEDGVKRTEIISCDAE